MHTKIFNNPQTVETGSLLSETMGLVHLLADQVSQYGILRCKCPEGRKPAQFAGQVKAACKKKDITVQIATHGDIITFIKG